MKLYYGVFIALAHTVCIVSVQLKPRKVCVVKTFYF